MTSRTNIKIFYFNGVNVSKHCHVAGEVFAISDCLVLFMCCRADNDKIWLDEWGFFLNIQTHQLFFLSNYRLGKLFI